MRFHLQRIGTVGLFITAITSPCCFPLFGFILTALGVGSFELFGEWSMRIFMILTFVSLIGLLLSYRIHRSINALIVAIPGAILIFYSYYFIDADYWINLVYVGMFSILAASGIDFYKMRMHKKRVKVLLKSVITCPICKHSSDEPMPVDACVYFYECKNCGERLKPKTGDCCVFCSYGTVKCPPIQMGNSCCT